MFHCGRSRANVGAVKNLTLSFKREQLLYDIENVAFVEGDVMDVQDEHRRHPVIDIAQDGNVDRVTRILDLAFAEAVEMLYPYTKQTAEDAEMDDELTETESYVVTMVVPIGFSRTTRNLISKLIHEYMICRVMEDWLSITDKPAAENWADKAQRAEEDIRSNLNARCGHMVRTQRPF